MANDPRCSRAQQVLGPRPEIRERFPSFRLERRRELAGVEPDDDVLSPRPWLSKGGAPLVFFEQADEKLATRPHPA